jgi:hypothetical protein
MLARVASNLEHINETHGYEKDHYRERQNWRVRIGTGPL